MSNSPEQIETSVESQISQELLNLKKEIAKTIVEKIYENANKSINDATKSKLVNYVIDEWKISDKIWDFFIKITEIFNWNFISSLKDVREILKKTNTSDELNKLKTTIQWWDSSNIQENISTTYQQTTQNHDDSWSISSNRTSESGEKDKNWSESSWNKNYNWLDSSWFSKWDKPFAHITHPYKWIKTYSVNNLSWKSLLPSGNKEYLATISDLWKEWTEWPKTTIKPDSSVTSDKFNKKSAWYKKNNPCNISPSSAYNVWLLWSSKVADWQNHAKYATMEDGIASYMRMIRQQKDSKWNLMYANKSIQWIDCWWMQGVYKENEDDSLKALRIIWITHACDSLKVKPTDRLNTDDKWTLMALAQQTAIQETWSHLSVATLERAYKKAFW